MLRQSFPQLFVAAALTCFASASMAATPGTYTLTDQWKIGGTGGWDYLAMDSATHRLFLSRGDRADVVDTTTGKIVGSIPNTQGIHGVALAPKLKRGFTSNGRGNSITVFDYDSLAVLREVAIPGQNPDAIHYEASTNHLYTFNGRSKDVTVLDASSLEVIGTIVVPGKPEFVQDDGKGHLFLNIETEPGKLLRIDSKTMKVAATWTLEGCNSPTGLALDSVHARVFSVCDDKVMTVTNAKTGKQVAKVTIGDGPDAVVYDAKTGLIFSSNGGDGTLSVVRQVSANTYKVVASVPTQRGARTMAFDASTGKAYLGTSDFGPAPAATAEQPHPRPTIVPDTFRVLVVEPR